MIQKRVTILLFLFIISCTSNTIYKKPKDLIDRNLMIDIWVDLYIAKGARSVKTKDLRRNIDYVPLVLRKYHIDSAQFSNSNIYYTSRIDEYEKMFKEVKKRLEAKIEIVRPKKALRDTLLKDNIKVLNRNKKQIQ